MCLSCHLDIPKQWLWNKIEISIEDPFVEFCWDNSIKIDDIFEVMDVPESEMDS